MWILCHVLCNIIIDYNDDQLHRGLLIVCTYYKEEAEDR